MGAYFEMFRRDRGRLADIYKRMNYCPLGSGALAGTTYPLDRAYTAELLGFDGPTLNSMDSVSDRDYVIDLLGEAGKMHHNRRKSTEELNDIVTVGYSTGSSIMPQKRIRISQSLFEEKQAAFTQL